MAPQILIVDDDEAVRTILACLLRSLHFDCESTSSAESALGLIEGKRYDVIITDYEMPGMNGIELIGKIREKSPFSPVILMTGTADDAAIRRCGPDGFLHKPFTAASLEEALTSALQSRQER